MSGERKIWDEHINCVNKKRVQHAREEYMLLLLVSLDKGSFSLDKGLWYFGRDFLSPTTGTPND